MEKRGSDGEAMTWYRVADQEKGTAVLIDAHTPEQAITIYLQDYPPDLLVEEVGAAEIKAWMDSDQHPYEF